MGKAGTSSRNGMTPLHLRRLRRLAAPVLQARKTMKLIRNALQEGGYGGDLRPALLTYLAMTSRLLAMRDGSMPAHVLLIGPASAGKSYTVRSASRLLPRSAYHVIDAGSPRALIYENVDLRHRVLIFGEADSLPVGEDNPAASAIRNLLQDHRLHYSVTARSSRSGNYKTQHIKKAGPTVLITTSTRRLGDQLESRLFIVEVRDDQSQVREALRKQAELELKHAPTPPQALVAYQAYLQALAPWDVVVPFAKELAEAIGRSPAASRVLRDYARLLALIKAAAVLRHSHRSKNAQGQLVASIADYKLVYKLVHDVYVTNVSGAGERVRSAVGTVDALLKSKKHRFVTVTLVAAELGITKMAASRRVRDALKGGWLINDEPRKGYPYRLALGDPLPEDSGLPRPETLEV